MLRERLSNNIYFYSHKDDKFKNNILTVNFVLPLSIENASKYAIMPYLLTICNEDYGDIVKLNKRFGELYGANLLVDVKKMGNFQILSIGINFIDVKYALDNKNITLDCCHLLFSILKRPYLVEGMFEEKNIKIAKKILFDKIDNRFNNKMNYAIDKCREYMFSDDIQKISKYGYRKDIIKLNNHDIKEAYYEIFSRSRIQVVYIGSEEEEVKEACKSLFENYKALPFAKLKLSESNLKNEVCDIEETMDISQSKLVLGFKCQSEISPRISREFIVLNILFGAAPFSKLFINIREKMGLCYNCSSRYDKFSNTIMVSMGIDSINKEKAIKETLKQLEEIKLGNFTDEEFENAKLIVKNLLLKSRDDVFEINDKCLSQCLLGICKSARAEIKSVWLISKEDIVKVANTIKLDTVYFLKGGNND